MSNDNRALPRSSFFFRLIGLGLRLLAKQAHYGKVVGLYEKGWVDNGVGVSGVVGYCYYQLSKYEKAIPLLQESIQLTPNNFYSRYFLAQCFKALNKKSEAIDVLVECLKLNFPQTDQILDALLPLAAQDFSKIAAAVEVASLSNVNRVKVLFYQHRDAEISAAMLEGVRLCPFYSAKALAEKGRGQYKSLGAPEKLRFLYFQNDGDVWTETNEVWVDTIPPYVAEISDATVMHNSSMILVGENEILSDLLAHAEYGRFADPSYDSNIIARRDDALLIKRPVPDVEMPEAVMLGGLASSAYGHWSAEFLPKLRFLEQHPRFSHMPILVDDGMPQSHYDFLAALVPNPIRRIAKGGSVKVGKLLVAPTDTYFPTEMVLSHSVPPEKQSSLTIGALKYIRDKIEKRFLPPAQPASRIFLSRQNSQWRRLTTDKEIGNDLKTLGFKTVCVENFSFEEQVRIFQDAAFIVAPNGSALNNLIFSNPKTKILILGQKNFFNWGGWFGSFKELGYTLVYMTGKTIGDEAAKHTDYFIPVERVRTKVQEMLKS